MAFKKKALRYGKRVAKKAYGMAKKRYVKKGGPNIKNIYNDVMMLKHLVNVEKKRFDKTTVVPLTVAQLATTGVSGQLATILSPNPAQGTSGATRVGNSIKVVSGCLDMKFSQQSGAINDMKLRWVIVCRPDNSANISAATAIAEFYEPNPFSGVSDYWSSRDPEYFNVFKVIKSGIIHLKQDQITSGQSIQQIKVPLKFNHHLKYNTDGSTTTTKNQFYLFVTGSAGDIGALSGAFLEYNMRWYYTDN